MIDRLAHFTSFIPFIVISQSGSQLFSHGHSIHLETPRDQWISTVLATPPNNHSTGRKSLSHPTCYTKEVSGISCEWSCDGWLKYDPLILFQKTINHGMIQVSVDRTSSKCIEWHLCHILTALKLYSSIYFADISQSCHFRIVYYMRAQCLPTYLHMVN